MAKRIKNSNLSIEERLEQALIPNWDEPYKLPENWCWVNLGSLGALGMGQTILSKDLKEEGIPVYSATEEDKIFGYISENENTIKLSSGDIVIPARGNSIGHVKYISCDEASCTQTTMFFKPFDKSIGKCVYYYMQGNKHKLFAYHGNAIPQITITNITKKEIPIPPLNEQQRIVERIESLFAKLDEAKEKAQKVIDGFETRKAAIFHKAFSGELTAKWREENDHSIADWEHHNFSDLCKIVRGGSPRPAGSPEFYGGDIPFMKVADITRITTPYVESTEHFIKPAGLKKTRMVKANTLLLTNSGATLGVPAICTFDTTFNDGIAAFLDLPSESLLFYYYFWTKKTPELRAINKGAAQPNLNTDIIGAVEIDVPSLEEQKVITNILEHLITKEQQVKEAAEAVVEQIDTMKKAILARAFRGELGTNDPSEESAVDLLKQVLSTATEPNKSVAKRTIIPNSLESRIKTDLERKIVKLYIQNEVDVLSIDLIMGVSSKKFEIMETLRNLQQRCLLEKQNDKYKLLG